MRTALAIMAGWGAWALGFVALYGFHGLHCGTRGLPADALRPSLLAIYALFVVLLLGWWLWTRRPGFMGKKTVHGFAARVTRLSALCAFIAWLMTGAPVLFTSSCL